MSEARPYMKLITLLGHPVTLACDGNCGKAWGTTLRPKVRFNKDDPDDFAYLADSELGDAPRVTRETEGGHDKPPGPSDMNKWCSRQCERSLIFKDGEPINLPDFSKRLYNMPWLHPKEPMTEESTLPPLPVRVNIFGAPIHRPKDGPLHSPDQMRAYALAAVQAAVRADREDAERYRCLRDLAELKTLPDGIAYYMLTVSKTFPPSANGKWGFDHAGFDEAVDAIKEDADPKAQHE